MGRPDKKRRREDKRKAKRREVRRRESVSPVKRLAGAKGEVECWGSEGVEEYGQVEFFVFKGAGGLGGVACFLVDVGVVGLKEAWVRMGMGRADVEDMVRGVTDNGVRMRRVPVEEVRRWVAGGVRWAQEHGMRLPREWVAAASIIGGVGDVATADVSGFCKEFEGHPEDLRQRLLAEPYESFLSRTDVEFVFDESAPYKDQRTARYIDAEGPFDDLDEEEIERIAAEVPAEEVAIVAAKFAPVARGLAEQTGAWLEAQGKAPSPEVAQAWAALMVANMLSKDAMPGEDEEVVADFAYDLLEDIMRQADEPRREELHRAVGQILEHLETDTMLMKKAVLKYGLASGAGGDDSEEGGEDEVTS